MGAEIRENRRYIAIRFPEHPSDNIRETMEFNGWRYSKERDCWFLDGVDEQARRFAVSLVDRFNRG